MSEVLQATLAQGLSGGEADSRCPLCGAPGAVLEPALADLFFGYPGQWRYDRCTAAACGVGWIAEPLPPEQLAEAYDRYYTHDAPPPSAAEIALGRWFARGFARRGDRFARLPFLFREAENHVLDAGALPPLAQGLALDVGCGGGERLDYLKAIGWGRARGVEFDPVAVARAREQGRDVAQGSAEAIPVEDGCADAVFLHHVVEHLADVRLALSEARRVLRPGGHLVITTPNLDSAGRTRWGPAWRGYEAPRHLRRYTIKALCRAVSEAGFAVRVARTSFRAAPFMNRESARVSPALPPRSPLPWWTEDRDMRRAEARRRAGAEMGEELFLVARAEHSA
jgi:SAM-dependent methyltransferase